MSNLGLFGIHLHQIPISRANGSFEILNSTENINLRVLGRVTNENVFLQTILDKRLYKFTKLNKIGFPFYK